MSPTHDDFYRAALFCLRVILDCDGNGSTLYEEVVLNIGLNELCRVARKEGDMKWSGLDWYMRRERRRAALRKAALAEDAA